MKKITMLMALFIALTISAQQHWSYQGKEAPEHWSEMEGNEKCGQSQSQSPINIVTQKTKQDKNLEKLFFNYTPGDIKEIEDNGHSLQFDFKEGSSINYGGKKYNLIQFHAHEESEHTINGLRYPLELHFVHKAMDGSVLVIAVMVKEGSENSYFEKLKIFKGLAKNAKEDTDIVFNPENMFPKNKGYYTYFGSLTTPPCSDNVTWIVFKNPIDMTEDEIEDISKHLPKSNNRPLQPLNERTILSTK
ncbi:carbonic anhydrase [Chryseobacterium nematophagum]|uniref:Carbonic anhydrase n=1 Tax=Chryseobacterium nematophagum TaxID=2305228 RepID=A0A3M7TEN6_9FLAO|nr:carbonic anhydrase family protein [Chryseobacterium nematophagum]RNA61337.1 carbonic anhydrase [Chryseobacterium nematophagum]